MQQATHLALRTSIEQLRRQRRACRQRLAAAWCKAAALELGPQRRHRAGNGLQRLAAPSGIGQGAQQRAGIGVLRRGEELVGRRHLDDLPGIHQRHALRHAGHHAQVVGDQQQAHLLLALQRAQQVQDLRLDGHVQRGGGFVGHQEVGLGGQRHGDHHALLLPARQAERVLVDAPLGLGDADAAQPFDGLGARRRAAQRGVRLDGLDDLVADAHHRVQAGRRLLEDHADARAAHAAHRGFGQAQHVQVAEPHLAVGDAAVLGQQAHQRQRRHALAAAAFAHQRKGLAALDAQANAVERAHHAGLGVELHLQVDGLQPVRAWFMTRPSSGPAAAGRRARAGRRHRARRRQTGWRPAPAPP